MNAYEFGGSGWRRFIGVSVTTLVAAAGAVAAFILILDPYQNVPFSPALARAPVDSNARYVYPGLARSAHFNSLIVGNSMTRGLDPVRLNRHLDAHFVNLSLPAGTAWEQHQLARVFLHHHAAPKFIIFGLDQYWCSRGKRLATHRQAEWPAWLYDDNAWNDLLYLFNDKVLTQAVRQWEYLRGQREPEFRPDGFGAFIPLRPPDLETVRRKIYGTRAHAALRALPPADVFARRPRSGARFPALSLLEELFARSPATTHKILLFVPRPVHDQRRRASDLRQCKGSVVELAAGYANTHVVDFLIPSSITLDDRSFWDQVHFTRPVARKIEHGIARAMAERRDRPEVYRYVTPDSLAH
jgi:hypothetical protein